MDVATRERVIRVLAGQSPDYYAYPNAATFAAEGLDAETVAAEFAALLQAGVLERENVVSVVRRGIDIWLENLRAAQAQVAAADDSTREAALANLIELSGTAEPPDETETTPGGFRLSADGRKLAGLVG